MPIYEYGCEACGREFEVLILRPSQAVACPSCGGANLQRRISSCGLKSGRSAGEPASTPARSGCGTCTSRHCSSCR